MITLDKAAEQLTAGVGVVLPRVNLLPPEIVQRQQLRRLQAGIGAGVVAALGAVALLTVLAGGAVSEAQEEVHRVDATHHRLVAETREFRHITALYAETDAAEAMLVDAMSEEVRFSRFLDQFSLTLPKRVWVTNLTFNQGAAAAVQGPAPAGAAGPAATGIGSVTVSGTAYSHRDVAVWLESLDAQEGFAGATLQSSTERLLADRVVVDFTTSVSLTPEALSGRYTSTGG